MGKIALDEKDYKAAFHSFQQCLAIRNRIIINEHDTDIVKVKLLIKDIIQVVDSTINEKVAPQRKEIMSSLLKEIESQNFRQIVKDATLSPITREAPHKASSATKSFYDDNALTPHKQEPTEKPTRSAIHRAVTANEENFNPPIPRLDEESEVRSDTRRMSLHRQTTRRDSKKVGDASPENPSKFAAAVAAAAVTGSPKKGSPDTKSPGDDQRQNVIRPRAIMIPKINIQQPSSEVTPTKATAKEIVMERPPPARLMRAESKQLDGSPTKENKEKERRLNITEDFMDILGPDQVLLLSELKMLVLGKGKEDFKSLVLQSEFLKSLAPSTKNFFISLNPALQG